MLLSSKLDHQFLIFILFLTSSMQLCLHGKANIYPCQGELLLLKPASLPCLNIYFVLLLSLAQLLIRLRVASELSHGKEMQASDSLGQTLSERERCRLHTIKQCNYLSQSVAAEANRSMQERLKSVSSKMTGYLV